MNSFAPIAALAALMVTASGGAAFAQGGEPTAPLGLQALIQRALAEAPRQHLADQNIALAEIQRDSTRAALLPQVGVEVSQVRQTTNPATLGFNFPGLPSLIGPYNVFDARVNLSQKVIDLARSSEVAGAGFAIDAAKAQADVSGEQLASNVALSYIQVLAGEQSLLSAQSDLSLANDLLSLARDQKTAGIATGVDVARAETAVAQDRYAVSEAQTRIAQARLQLQRLAVLPMQDVPTLTGRLDAGPGAEPGIVPELGTTPLQALNVARGSRSELRAVEASISQADAKLQAARRRRLPTLSVVGNYGLSSKVPGEADEDTYRYGAVIDVPIYSGGSLQAEDAAATNQLEQQRLQMQDLEQQIEQDVRLALATLANSVEQVRAAVSARDLAQRELDLARDRFTNGVANNLDVVTAQASLARARAQYVEATAAQQQARVNLAAAQGRARQFDL
jgi:outer membrane protein TolC